VSLIDGEDDVDDGVVDERLLLPLLVLVFAWDVAGVLLPLVVLVLGVGDSDAPLIGVPGLLLLLVRMLVVELLLFAELFVLFASEAISTKSENKILFLQTNKKVTINKKNSY
jgi:hypothetical protein